MSLNVSSTRPKIGMLKGRGESTRGLHPKARMLEERNSLPQGGTEQFDNQYQMASQKTEM